MRIVYLLIVILIISSPVIGAITDDLILYCPYDEGYGQVTHDLSGNGFHGMLYNQSYQSGEIGKWKDPGDQIWISDGKFGSAVSFYDGQYVHTGSGNIIGGKVMDTHVLYEGAYDDPWGDGQDRTYSFWLRRPPGQSISLNSSWVNEWEINGTEGVDWIAGDESSVDYWGGELGYDHLHTRLDEWSGDDRILRIGLNAGTAWEKFNVGRFQGNPGDFFGNNVWQNVIITIDGHPEADGSTTDRMIVTVYINGSVSTQTEYSNAGWGSMRMEAFTVAAPQGPKGIDIGDQVDDVAVWSRVLNSTEIAWLQNNPVMPTQPQPPIPVGPYDGGKETNGWKLSWEDGVDPYVSYDVYLGRDYDDVFNADNSSSCTPGSSNITGDIDDDCQVDEYDLVRVADCWLSPSSCDSDADLYGDGSINFLDFSTLAGDWMEGNVYVGNVSDPEYFHYDLKVGQTYYWRVDGIQSGGGSSTGNVLSFTVVDEWVQPEFFNYLGWTELQQMRGDLRDDYADDIYNLYIRHAMDNNVTIDYFSQAGFGGIKVGFYHNPTLPVHILGYEDDPYNWGYHQYDEPKNDKTPNMADVAREHLNAHYADPTRPSLTNLYSSDGVAGSISAYIDTFFDAVDKAEILSYDHYPYRYGIGEHWENLEVFRTYAKANDIPLFCWSDAKQGSSSAGSTNRNRLRWCNYSRLAYGVKGICWFNIEKLFNYGSEGYGNRTYSLGSYYTDVQTVNSELNIVGNEMLPLQSTVVYHTNAPTYTTPLPGGFWVQASSNRSDGLVLGMFTHPDNDLDYAMVCNKDDASTATMTVTFQNTAVSQVRIFSETGANWTTLPIQGSYPGQYVTFDTIAGLGKLLEITKP